VVTVLKTNVYLIVKSAIQRRIKMVVSSKIKPIAIGVGIVVIIAAISAYSMSGTKSTELTTAPEGFTILGLEEGNIAPNFSLIDPEKGSISKQSFEGKPLFVFFTTGWCTPCQIGAQNLAKFDDEKGGDAFNVLIVFVDDRESDPQFIQWREEFGRNDWYVAKGIEMAETYQVKFLDTKYVFDKDGVIRWVDVRPLAYSTIGPVLGSLLET